jgi:hypothetical protein
MKIVVGAILSGVLLLGASGARAEDSKAQAKSSAKQAGKTAAHGTTAVGKGASKIYHEAAKGIHKTIAKNATNDKTRIKHQQKAAAHDQHAARKAAQSKKELKEAGKSADRVTK